ncbi:Putative teichuronic acid biosynthesis glycosyltransferase TuaH [Caballeronia hypogeia]|uniref:Teichuronic acid biosynthesis glycosyltransferase TuaH n=1 Tax=Caballeronia hypogeia TaxID=1777140 RepID=A0A158BME1_9BURK|nr:glycosyl transferase [Caballeronia hypogeia]SAK70467.1 Putative teichuronic acid biosynthesis glycosyltransferase TuaH [Caballeronia hypogeia]
MRQLVYLSPLPWASFAQRPHKFVEWFHATTGGRVLWIDPYATRLPALRDLRRPSAGASGATVNRPKWVTVEGVRALPIEPMPGGTFINRLAWRAVAERVARFCAAEKTLLVIGKPSAFAFDCLEHANAARSAYDSMDDFPAFYTGVSRAALARVEERIAAGVDRLLVSSTALRARWQTLRPDARLIYNGLDPGVLPAADVAKLARLGDGQPKIIGYLGTMGPWFDWAWLTALAKQRPNDAIRLIGPVFSQPTGALPGNVRMLPPVPHAEALKAMREFDIGLIPFIRNQLTDGVDPIKYYEYRAMGLPVISTGFGEMRLRGNEPATFLIDAPDQLGGAVDAALRCRASDDGIAAFREANSWAARFDASGVLE